MSIEPLVAQVIKLVINITVPSPAYYFSIVTTSTKNFMNLSCCFPHFLMVLKQVLRKKKSSVTE